MPLNAVSPVGSTSTSTRPLDLFYRQAAANRRLTPEEEKALAQEFRAARERLWTTLLSEPRWADEVLASALRHLPVECGTTVSAEALAQADRDHDAANAAITFLHEVLGPSDSYRAAVERAAARVKQIRDRFIAANLGLVVVLARRYERGHFTLEDLVQEGNTGLMKAVDRFDAERGFRFSTYAVWWIRHAIGRALSDKSREIRLPVHVAERHQTLLRRRAEFEQAHGRLPTPAELASAMDLPVEKVEDLISVDYIRASTFDRAREGMGPMDVAELPDEVRLETLDAGLDQESFELGLRQSMRGLPEMERDILARRFGLGGGEPMTLREVGEVYGLSRERIRQIQARALEQLRREFARRGLV